MPPEFSQSGELARLASEAMRAAGLLAEFSIDATRQANGLTQAAIETDPAIRDLRALSWSSIDNDESRDLDQIEVAQQLTDGAVKILIAIADVDAMVKPASPIDQHARINTTSVYTAARVFPMLPEKLSTNLTSLAPDQERLAIVIEMTVDPDGALRQSDIYRGIVINRAQLAYSSVGAWLDGTGTIPQRVKEVDRLEVQLHTQDKVAKILQRQRHDKGALNLQTIEPRAIFDDGLLIDLRPDLQNSAQQLIENLMIAANGVTARYLEQKGLPSLRRILRTPKRWDRIVALAKTFNEQLPDVPDALALNAFLTKRRESDTERFADLSLSVVKLLGKGEYALKLPGQNIEGHFGLAVHDYSHSTAPNRRFVDLITQRLVKAALRSEASPYSEAELQELAARCTEQESNAAKVERQVRKSAAAMLLATRIGQSFDAVVTGASDKGTWVRISAPAAEGRVVKGFRGINVGDRVRVELVHTDTARGFIDFARVE